MASTQAPRVPSGTQLSEALSLSALKGQCWARPRPRLSPLIRSEAQG